MDTSVAINSVIVCLPSKTGTGSWPFVGWLGSTVHDPTQVNGSVYVGQPTHTSGSDCNLRDWTQVPYSVESRTSLASTLPKVIGITSYVSINSGCSAFFVFSLVSWPLS